MRSNLIAWHFIKSSLKTSVNGGCATSMRELLQCLTVLMVKKFLLKSSLNLSTLNEFGLDDL